MKRYSLIVVFLIALLLLFAGCLQKQTTSNVSDAKLFKELSDNIKKLIKKDNFKLITKERMEPVDTNSMQAIEAKAYFFKYNNNIKIVRETPFATVALYKFDNNLIACYMADENTLCFEANKQQKQEFDSALQQIFSSTEEQITKMMAALQGKTTPNIKIEKIFYIKKLGTKTINKRQCTMFNLKPNYEELTKILPSDFNKLQIDVNTCIDNEVGVSLITNSLYTAKDFALRYTLETKYSPNCKASEVLPSKEILAKIRE